MLITELVTLPPCCALALSHTLVSSFLSSCYVTLYPEGKKKNKIIQKVHKDDSDRNTDTQIQNKIMGGKNHTQKTL